MIFDRYLLAVQDKTRNVPPVAFDEVTLFGLYVHIFVSGFQPDPTRGTAKIVYHKSHDGIISKLIKGLSSLPQLIRGTNDHEKR